MNVTKSLSDTLRKFGKKRDCLKVLNISAELENAIISSNTSKIYRLIRKTIEQNM